MTSDQKIFKELDTSTKWRVRIKNIENLPEQRKGTVAVESYKGTKLIYEVLFVPEIDQSV